MATPISGSFDVWLTEKLTSVSADIDTDVFVSYIISILEEDGDDEDTEESIAGLLAGVIEEDAATETTKAVMGHWEATKDDRTVVTVQEDMGDKLSEMLGNQTLATVKERTLTKEEAERKAAILAQYAQVSDGEESEEEDHPAPVAPTCPVVASAGDDQTHNPVVPSQPQAAGGGKPKVEVSDPLLMMRNSNKEAVQRAEQEKREKAKEDGEKKKEKDKQDRAAQKTKQQERKDKEKNRTQKGEKRR